jgi:UDP-N-acetylmuramoylalanine--D-glutamate ligase
VVKERISKVVLIGEATQRFKEELANSGYINIVNSKTLEEAIDIASLDKPDVVLLSPACASFDMFESYEKRGEAFRNYVLSKK